MKALVLVRSEWLFEKVVIHRRWVMIAIWLVMNVSISWGISEVCAISCLLQITVHIFEIIDLLWQILLCNIGKLLFALLATFAFLAACVRLMWMWSLLLDRTKICLRCICHPRVIQNLSSWRSVVRVNGKNALQEVNCLFA